MTAAPALIDPLEEVSPSTWLALLDAIPAVHWKAFPGGTVGLGYKGPSTVVYARCGQGCYVAVLDKRMALAEDVALVRRLMQSE